MSARPTVDAWFMGFAALAAERGTCLRAKVGCAIARGNRLLVMGYVGSPPGAEHCLDVGCCIGPSGGCQRTLHAEANAIQWARDLNVDIVGATAYVTLSPCATCMEALHVAGVYRVVYRDAYRLSGHLDRYRALGMIVEQRQH